MKNIKIQCPICLEERTVVLDKRRKTNFCQKCVSTGTQKNIRRPDKSGTNSGRWNGGEYISSDGYRMIKCEGEYHPSGRQKYKKEHVLVMEKFLGRELKTQKGGIGESVHHIDGDKLNNNIDNLILCNGSEDHRNLHANLEKVSYDLVRNGTIGFDNVNRKYYIRSSNG
jgi:hypothetical protein